MRNKLSALLVFAAALTLAPCMSRGVYSQQQGAGVAGSDPVARGKNDSSRVPARRRSPRDSVASSEDESNPGISGRRIAEIESLEEQCLNEINRIRRSSRLPRLDFYAELLPVARAYSRRMAEEHFFSHDDPDGRTVRERVDDADIKWRMVGENLAYSNGYVNPVAASLHGWMDSPTHRKNILDPDFRLTAIGAWIGKDGTVFFTEIFLKP